MFRLIKRCLVLGLFVVLLSAATVVWWVAQPLPMTLLKGATAIDLQVKPNATPLSVAKDLSASGVTVPSWVLFEWFRWSGEATQIKAGSYEIAPGLTPRGLLDMLTSGKQATRRVTIVEGWTFAQMRQALASAPTLRSDTDSLSDAELMTRIGRPGVHPEGRFFPDTYVYPKNGSDVDLYKQAAAQMDSRVAAAWKCRDSRTPVDNQEDLLILASIVEKETNHDADRALVAGVFANRLRIGMRLQTDPTVIYGLGDAFNGNLQRKHLRSDTPYNSYTRAGLPPTPIALPSEASLKAAVNPVDTDAFYFVAKGDGTSAFSPDLAAHNRAVRRFILKQP